MGDNLTIKIKPLSKSTGNLLADCSALCADAYVNLLNLQMKYHYTASSGHPEVMYHDCPLCDGTRDLLIDLSRAHMLLRGEAEVTDKRTSLRTRRLITVTKLPR